MTAQTSGKAVLALARPLVMRFEAFRARPYLCPARRWTIGYGATHYCGGRAVNGSDPPVDEAQAEAMLCAELSAQWDALRRRLKIEPPAAQGAAMLSLAYNIGIAAFVGSTLLAKFNVGDLAGAADEFLKWNKARSGGKLIALEGLARRRRAERTLFLKG